MTETNDMNRGTHQPIAMALLPAPRPCGRRPAPTDASANHHAGEPVEAEILTQSVTDSRLDDPIANYALGIQFASIGQLQEAVTSYRRAIAMRQDFVEAYINLGTTVLTLGRPEEAAALYRQAIAFAPGNAMAHGNLGKVLQDLGRIEEAVAAHRTAAALEPSDATIQANLGAALLERKDWTESAAVTRNAIALAPDNAMAHANLAGALLCLGRHDEALAACRLATEKHPYGAAIHSSLGGTMLELGVLPEALALCRQAIVLDPAAPGAWFNLSHALKAMNLLDEAARAAGQAIMLRPDWAEYHFHLGHILLLQGDMRAGWMEYDWRWDLPAFSRLKTLHKACSLPPWTGDDIRGKTILISAEQGLGDIILFARYLPMVARRAGHVIVAAYPSMRGLLETIEGITVVSDRDSPLPAFDVHCPLLSLPRAFGTTLDSIPSNVPYLRADPSKQARWHRRTSGGVSLRVGIVWAGNAATPRDRFRSPGFAAVFPLFALPGIDFIFLQVAAGREDLDANLLPPHVLDLGEEVADLTDTAAIMSGLDLMISSCTAPLHLAGALGVPTWAMIPFAPYFPWLLERGDSPWYPTMRLYRQEAYGRDWSGVIARIAADLATLAETKLRHQPSAARDSPPAGEGMWRAALPDQPAALRSEISMDSSDAGDFNELARCRDGPMLYNRNDIYIGASLRKYGEFSGEETALFRLIVQPGRTVLDVGANIGAHTIDLSRLVGAAGAVHAFEPQRLAFQLLCANVALNNRANVFTHQAAVGAASGTLRVPSLDPAIRNNYGGLSLLESQSGETVPLVTIDGLDLGDCQFIKIDVEGMETEALRGAVKTIDRFRPILYVENDRQAQSAELIGLVQSFGYRLYWHLPPLYVPGNFRGDAENIFGKKVSVNMICIPTEIPQASLTNLREVTGPADSVISW